MCSASGSTHTESGKLYRKVKHQARPKVSSRQRPKRAPTDRQSPRRLRHRAPHTEHGLGVPSRVPFKQEPIPLVCLAQVLTHKTETIFGEVDSPFKLEHQRNRLAWPHRRRGLASDGVRYSMRAHGAASAAGFEALRD